MDTQHNELMEEYINIFFNDYYVPVSTRFILGFIFFVLGIYLLLKILFRQFLINISIIRFF